MLWYQPGSSLLPVFFCRLPVHSLWPCSHLDRSHTTSSSSSTDPCSCPLTPYSHHLHPPFGAGSEAPFRSPLQRGLKGLGGEGGGGLHLRKASRGLKGASRGLEGGFKGASRGLGLQGGLEGGLKPSALKGASRMLEGGFKAA